MESFMIKDATKKLGIEAHVLRYWEEELKLEIKRNSMGHRYYDEKDIRMFGEIKRLRDEGISLKEIRESIEATKKKDEAKPTTDNVTEAKTDAEICVVDKQQGEASEGNQGNIVDFKAAQLQTIMNKIVANAFRENKSMLTSAIKSEITEDVMKQMDVIIKEKEEREEARFRRLDESIRQIQRANDEAAATRTKRRFGKKRY